MKIFRAQQLLVSFFLTSTIGIVVYTMYAAFHYSSNAILGRDEANFIILSSEKILAANSVGELVAAFFPSHGQHTLLGMQLVNMFTYFSFGALDRRIMNVIGVMLLCIAALLLPGARWKNRSERILACATLFPLIFSPAHNACIVNASCTGNHYFGIAASVTALYFFTKSADKKIYFVGAEFFMLLAIFSLPASLALVPVSLLILFRNAQRKKSNVMAIHLAFIAAILALHSYLTFPNTVFSFAQNAEPFSFSGLGKSMALFAATFFIIVGSLFYWLGDLGYTWILAVAGMVISGLAIIAIIKTCKSADRDCRGFAFYGVLLFLAMILIISFGRYYSLGSSRYSVYTAFLCAMLLMLFYHQLNQSDEVLQVSRRRKILFASASLSLIYFLTALHYHQQYLLHLEQKDVTCREMWYREGYACGVMISHEEATQIIKNAINQGIYRIEK